MNTNDIVRAVSGSKHVVEGAVPEAEHKKNLEAVAVDNITLDTPELNETPETPEKTDPFPGSDTDEDIEKTRIAKKQEEALEEAIQLETGGGGGNALGPPKDRTTFADPFPNGPQQQPVGEAPSDNLPAAVPQVTNVPALSSANAPIDATYTIVDNDNDNTGGGNTGGGKEPKNHWKTYRLLSGLLEGVAKTGGAAMRGAGAIGGASLKALGNLPAVLDTTGAAQKSAFGGTTLGAAAKIGEGLGGVGSAMGTGVGNVAASAVEGVLGPIADTLKDQSDIEELEAMRDMLLKKVEAHVLRLKAQGLPVSTPSVYNYLKNLVYTEGLHKRENK